MKPSLRNAVHQLKRNAIEQAIGSVWGMMDVLGVEKPSPLNTWPKCPPHAAQVISMRVIPRVLSSCRFTAPGIAEEEKKSGITFAWKIYRSLWTRQRLTIEKGRPSTSTLKTSFWPLACNVDHKPQIKHYIEFGSTFVQSRSASGTIVYTWIWVFVVLASSSALSSFLTENPELIS